MKNLEMRVFENHPLRSSNLAKRNQRVFVSGTLAHPFRAALTKPKCLKHSKLTAAFFAAGFRKLLYNKDFYSASKFF